jgi:hypothetical protein
MVGDSIFPGQSTASVALGGLRVAKAILRQKPEAQSFTENDTRLKTNQKDSEESHVEI